MKRIPSKVGIGPDGCWLFMLLAIYVDATVGAIGKEIGMIVFDCALNG
jgi:hypothetical protein